MRREADGERQRRRAMWEKLIDAGGPLGVKPGLLRRLGIYGGAQGIWVDKRRTAQAMPPTGVTVGLLHRGQAYADDLGRDGVLYHYPDTNRPAKRDETEVNATKAAQASDLPVFVITQPSQSTRDVHLGWVEDWDDDAKLFLITFGDTPPATAPQAESVPFELTTPRELRTQEVPIRSGQARFKLAVIKRYGPRCAICDLPVLSLLDAAHLRPVADRGSDDPRNGLVLCANHHRALDVGLIRIEPDTLRIVCSESGPSAQELGVTRADLRHLLKPPHRTALAWLWRKHA